MEFFEIFLNQFTIDLKFIIALFIFFCIDFICGFSKGVFIEGVSSTKLKKSVTKLIAYVGLILMCLTLDTLIILAIAKESSYIAVGATVATCGIEAKSIVENLKELGIDIPEIVLSGIKLITNSNKEETNENE